MAYNISVFLECYGFWAIEKSTNRLKPRLWELNRNELSSPHLWANFLKNQPEANGGGAQHARFSYIAETEG